MRIEILRSGSGEVANVQFTSSYLVNENVAIDAGCLAYALPFTRLKKIEHVFLTHSHLDHVASLPILLDLLFDNSSECVTVHGSEATLEVLRRDLLNDRVWPDFVKLSTPESAFLRLAPLEEGKPVQVGNLTITPVPVSHTVPTVGYLVEDESAVIFSGDTGPTEQLWQCANRTQNLKAIFIETTFPSAMEQLARIADHLTPELLRQELRKLERDVDVIVVHIHPRHRETVLAELEELRIDRLKIGQPGTLSSF